MQSIISEDNYCSFSCGSTLSLDCGFHPSKAAEGATQCNVVLAYIFNDTLPSTFMSIFLPVCLMHVPVLAGHRS